MLTIAEKDFICSVCGSKSAHKYIVDSSAEGDSDLDLRTSEPHRSSMEYWTATCPVCGYCAESIEVPANISPDFLKSEKYLSADGIETESSLAMNFIKKALIKLEAGNTEDALQSYIYASWSFDDAMENENAAEMRCRAVTLIDQFLAESYNHNYDILKADLLRRAGKFQEVIDTYSEKTFGHPSINAIINFEIEKSKEQDDKVYQFHDAIK